MPASRALAKDPLVQYHVGRAYQDAGQTDQALAAFKATLELVDDGDTRAQIQDAKQRVDDLSTANQQ